MKQNCYGERVMRNGPFAGEAKFAFHGDMRWTSLETVNDTLWNVISQ